MRDIVISLFGSYTPIYTSVEGVETVAYGFAGVDWTYIAGVTIFCICLISLFKILGVFLKR